LNHPIYGSEEFVTFIKRLNKHHRTIEFTWDTSSISQNFLDVTVHLRNSVIVTDLYTKPTDTPQYLHPSSCHPGHVKRAIAFPQALRILNICYKRSSALVHLGNLVQFLNNRGHSKKKVKKEKKKALHRFDNKVSIPHPRPYLRTHPLQGVLTPALVKGIRLHLTTSERTLNPVGSL
jgi:hypothetical protein